MKKSLREKLEKQERIERALRELPDLEREVSKLGHSIRVCNVSKKHISPHVLIDYYGWYPLVQWWPATGYAKDYDGDTYTLNTCEDVRRVFVEQAAERDEEEMDDDFSWAMDDGIILGSSECK